MDIDLDLYKVFVSVASNESVSKASDELGVTQSAVSQSILKLEKIYGEELFIRSRQGVMLTSSGKELYDNISSEINSLSKVYEKIKSSNKKKDVIKLGASDTLTINLLLPIIKKHYSNLQFYVESLISDKEKIIAVENGSLDFAIINDYNLPLSSNLYKKKLISLEYGFYYNKDTLNFDENDLFNQTLIVKNAGTKGRVEFNKKFYNIAYKFKNTMEFSHDDIIIEATKMGLGIGFCPKEYVNNSLTPLFLSEEKIIKDVVLIYQQKSEIIDTIVSEMNKK